MERQYCSRYSTDARFNNGHGSWPLLLRIIVGHPPATTGGPLSSNVPVDTATVVCHEQNLVMCPLFNLLFRIALPLFN
jgi:hypothetical protein